MIHEEIKKYGISTTDQPCFYHVEKRVVIVGNFRCLGQTIWCIQDTGLSLCTAGQKEPGPHPGSRTPRGLHGKTWSEPDQGDKSSSLIDGVINQCSSKHSTGRVFIKTRPWRKKRDALNYPVRMTGLGSKSSHRFTVFLSRVLNGIVPRVNVFHL